MNIVARVLRPVGWLVLVLVVGVAGCGSSHGQGHAVTEVENKMRKMLSDLEHGDYTDACEAFTLRSRYAMAIGPVFDGHESDSSCADVFIIANTLDNLGLSGTGRALRAHAVMAGLAKVVDLPGEEVHKFYHGIGTTSLAPVVSRMEIEGDTARYRDNIVARFEGGHWLLEAVTAKTTYREVREDIRHECASAPSKEYLGLRLCNLMEAVVAGDVFSGARHREFDRLLPRAFMLASHEFARATKHLAGGSSRTRGAPDGK